MLARSTVLRGIQQLVAASLFGSADYALSQSALKLQRPAEVASTLTGRHIVGYQGWFVCRDGVASPPLFHWLARGERGVRSFVDFLPDMSEFAPSQRCRTDLFTKNGGPAEVFSSLDPLVVLRHFLWMKDYDIDGAALQRFLISLRDVDSRAEKDLVLANVRRAAAAAGRSYFIMYDVAGAAPGEAIKALLTDWDRLNNELRITEDPFYARHTGRPVLAVTGLGFRGRQTDASEARQILGKLKQSGVALLGSVPTNWRTLDGDQDPHPDWLGVSAEYDIISPWMVGRLNAPEHAEQHVANRMARDLALTASRQQDYMPVVYPGFSWFNLKRGRAPLNQIPRRCGQFYWAQVHAYLRAGSTMLYTAMFDEVDEGTAIFKMATDQGAVPSEPPFVTLDADKCELKSDWYLKLAGAATRALRDPAKVSPQIPLDAK